MKRKITKLLSVLMLVVLCLSLFGCGQEKVEPAVDEPVVTEEPQPEETPQAEPEQPENEPEAAPTFADFRFTEPEQFAGDPNDPMRLLSPSDSSFIEISLLEADAAVLENDKASYTEYLTNYYTEALGETADVFIDSFSVKKIDGVDGVRAMYFVETASFWAYILEVTTVVDENNIRVIFADTTQDNKWMDAFTLSAKTIDVVWSDELDGFDYSQYQLCDNGKGMTVRLALDMKYAKTEGLAMFYSSDACMMSSVREGFDEYEAAGIDAAAMSKEEYAALIQAVNGFEDAFSPDENGEFFLQYTNEVEGNTFAYYTTLRKGTDAFWLVHFACLEADSAEYMPLFEIWADSITVE